MAHRQCPINFSGRCLGYHIMLQLPCFYYIRFLWDRWTFFSLLGCFIVFLLRIPSSSFICTGIIQFAFLCKGRLIDCIAVCWIAMLIKRVGSPRIVVNFSQYILSYILSYNEAQEHLRKLRNIIGMRRSYTSSNCRNTVNGAGNWQTLNHIRQTRS